MATRYLLDTNTCIAVMRGNLKAVQRMALVPPTDCSVSTITAFELYTGVEKCAQPLKERTKVDLLLLTVHQSPFEQAAAKEAARIRALLEDQGRMIGPYDVLLAGQALAGAITLVTANTNEFSRVPGLPLEYGFQHEWGAGVL
jgi:tRNA(fMet)-specific endonuclease VapC